MVSSSPLRASSSDKVIRSMECEDSEKIDHPRVNAVKAVGVEQEVFRLEMFSGLVVGKIVEENCAEN